MPDTVATEKPQRLQCRHIFNNGNRCGAVCLRNKELCYYHDTTRRAAATPSNDQSTFELPLPEDRSAIQTSIGLVLQRIASNQLDPRRAGLLLYGLQIASLNLPKEHHDPDRITPPPVDEVILHPELGPLAPEAELPPPYRNSREQLIDWQERDLRRRATELDRRERELNERAEKIRAAERSQPAIVPDIKAEAVSELRIPHLKIEMWDSQDARVPHSSRSDEWAIAHRAIRDSDTTTKSSFRAEPLSEPQASRTRAELALSEVEREEPPHFAMRATNARGGDPLRPQPTNR